MERAIQCALILVKNAFSIIALIECGQFDCLYNLSNSKTMQRHQSFTTKGDWSVKLSKSAVIDVVMKALWTKSACNLVMWMSKLS